MVNALVEAKGINVTHMSAGIARKKPQTEKRGSERTVFP